ncbi:MULTISPECIES: type VII secretion protein EccE [Actinoplanes]|uniref:type VII secretion protein EccE n=1 Tax=Actinoplanes TaxID=1865 RepID=UPI0005F28377|nr:MULTISPECIES: type VII secretion protein EccE [Actinoplanes]GLY01737.1 hypothetical protein Acsp01_21160 [Actinoplanes sp. NBRC 101535]
MLTAPPEFTARPVRRPGRIGPLSTTQILVAELCLVAVVAAGLRGPVPLAVASGVAAVLLTVFFARRGHRWWLEHRALVADHRRRRADAGRTTGAHDRSGSAAGSGPVLDALRGLAPGLAVADVSTADGGTVGVGRDGAGWFSTVALAPDAPPVPLDTLVGLLAGADQPGVLMQLGTQTVPAPSPDVHPSSPAGTSYRQVLAGLGNAPVPAHRETAISVRIDAYALAEALQDHTADPEEAAALVASLARKVATGLRRIGVGCRTLDARQLVALLARSCDVEPGPLATAGAPPAEEWTHWRSARLIHRTYWLRTWPAPADGLGSLFAWAATAPAAQTTVTLVIDPSGGTDVAVRAFVRLATRPDTDLGDLDRVLVDGARRVGADLLPLDGEQGPATYATAPTGGGAG